MPTPLTTSEEDLICRDYKSGESLDSICKTYKIGITQLKKLLKESGVKQPKKDIDFSTLAKDYEKGKSLKTLAVENNVSLSHMWCGLRDKVKFRDKGRNRKFDYAYAKHLYSSGLTFRDIAKLLDVSPEAVRLVITQLQK